MQQEKFKILEFIREFVLAIDKELINFPKKEIEIKRRIRDESFNLLEIAYEANTTLDIEIKQQLIVKIIAKVKYRFTIDMTH